jgi:hypothetical protein
MLAFLVESPQFFSGKRKCKIPKVLTVEEAAKQILAALKLETQPDNCLLEIYDAQWEEYVHLENISELKDRSKIKLSSAEAAKKPSEEPTEGETASPTKAAPRTKAASPTKATVEQKFRAQLLAIYTAKCPEKLGDVEDLVQKYKGREKDALQIVRKKYGVQEQSGRAGDSSAKEEKFRAQLLTIYSAKCPEKLGDVEELVQKYKGREEKALQIVRDKYDYRVKDEAALVPVTAVPPAKAAPIKAAPIKAAPEIAAPENAPAPSPSSDIARSLTLLEGRLLAAVEMEDYDRAAAIDEEILKLKGSQQSDEAIEAPTPKPAPPPITTTSTSASTSTATAAAATAAAASGGDDAAEAGSDESDVSAFSFINSSSSPTHPTSTSSPSSTSSPTSTTSTTGTVSPTGSTASRSNGSSNATTVSPTNTGHSGHGSRSATTGPQAAAKKSSQGYSSQGYNPAKSYSRRLAALLREYNPEKLPEVDSLLAKYKGAEEELLQSVLQKYGGRHQHQQQQHQHQHHDVRAGTCVRRNWTTFGRSSRTCSSNPVGWLKAEL